MEFFGSKAGAPPLKFLFSSDGEKPSLEEGSEESAQVLLRPCGGSCNKDSLYLDFVNLKAYLSGLGILSSLSSHFPASNALPPLVRRIPTLLVGFGCVCFSCLLCISEIASLFLVNLYADCRVSSIVVMAWNVRGLGNKKTVRALRNSVWKFQLDIVLLSETKQQKRYVEKIKMKMKTEHLFYVALTGLAGGLSLWWTKDTQRKILQYGKHFIDAEISIRGETGWFKTFIYGPPYKQEKREFWEFMTNLRNGCGDRWMVIGDSNVISSQEEKLGGLPFNLNDARCYFDFIDAISLIELPISGGAFTWSNKTSVEDAIFEKLDQAMCSMEWNILFPKAVAMLDISIGSDHALVTILL
ncbi:hypothetical protein V6N11_081882 [Hibiscus sabdariffa]|uniref:Endonuclease/exonuclease/phosphatase domain-containing protein n=2 Tax=Hibiscus sabdariffa TaxID=183260 RepID=A0ABR2Q801_9ROSI